MKNCYEQIKELTFGVELEYENISIEKAARVVAGVFGTSARYVGGCYSAWKVPMADGREWTCEYDGSLTNGSETVSPVMTLDDMDAIQQVVRALRTAGAKARGTCGLHIHIGAKDMTARQVMTLSKMWYMDEGTTIAACGTVATRLSHYTRETDKNFIEKVAKMHGASVKLLENAYYAGNEYGRDRTSHYCQARYRTLNLHNYFGYQHGYSWAKPTVEFRLFEATTHAGEVKANILLALSVVARAKYVSGVRFSNEDKKLRINAKNDIIGWFKKMGWTTEYFNTARAHIIKRIMAAG